jgi:hypothetical protein
VVGDGHRSTAIGRRNMPVTRDQAADTIRPDAVACQRQLRRAVNVDCDPLPSIDLQSFGAAASGILIAAASNNMAKGVYA